MRTGIAKIILVSLLISICTLATGCTRLTPRAMQFVHYSDVTGDVLVLEKFHHADESFIFFKAPRRPTVTSVISIETGEIFSEYSSLYCESFSPDGNLLLKLDTRATRDLKEPVFSLNNSNNNEEIWKTEIELGFLFDLRLRANWDHERDLLIVGFLDLNFTPTDIPTDRASSGIDLNGLSDVHVFTLKLSDGSIIAHHVMNLTLREYSIARRDFVYGGGRIFISAEDDPFTEKRDTGGEQYHIYAIDTITAEIQKFDMSDFSFGAYDDFLVTETGDRIFFQNGNTFHVQPEIKAKKGICALDTETGEISLLLGHIQRGSSYSLRSITPDGSRISMVANIVYGREGDLAVYDVETDEIIVFESALDTDESNLWISPSGKHLVEWSYDHDLWVHDIETGEKRILVTSKGKDWKIFMPYLPGGNYTSRF